MLVGNTDTPHLILLLAGLVLIVAGVAAIRLREGIAEAIGDLRDQFFGVPLGRDRRKPVSPVIPIVAGAILIALGLVGAYGGLFAELPQPRPLG